MSKITLTRSLAVISMLIVVPLGLLCKKYIGFGQEWIHGNCGDIFYEIFWCLFVFCLIPTRQAANRIRSIEPTQIWTSPNRCLFPTSKGASERLSLSRRVLAQAAPSIPFKPV